MKYFLSVAVTIFITLYWVSPAKGQRACGHSYIQQQLSLNNPAELQQLNDRHKTLLDKALRMNNSLSNAKATAQYAIPIVFHFIVTNSEYAALGHDSGIKRRVLSQIIGLNKDFNRRNADSFKIPTAFKPLYSSVGIQFGLANGTNASTIAPGIEVKIIPAAVSYDVNTSCANAKVPGASGFAAWDVSKYMNIWVVNISGSSGTIIGVTTPPSFVNQTVNGHFYSASELGIVLNYGAIGVREYPLQNFINNIDLGRTLTHEMGHFFEMWHIWGDDGGACPSGSGYHDDEIADTPPQGGPNYGAPTFPKFSCSGQPNGDMFMNFMDYVDDRAMQMFTTQQGFAMRNFLLAESYSLTQNPQLLLDVSDSIISQDLVKIWPNPTRDIINVSVEGGLKLSSIDVINMMGQRVSHINTDAIKTYNIDLGNAARGIYFVQCRFAEGTVTKKIVLE